ncbi:GNAT family N-acetyltransferase [Ahrensia sp. R2A130]|uniref:GNAT family N-acetyltransferase n=1 Tax=Ahrensia sp. R2A130 TaxID=744979 RepID=UPI0001E0D86F|nr:GNAT family protein [Ahrensia sp. R2A130]EFL88895.1 ribosomal-protein-alanine acetyltransferase [Ahrensia sp. R2A130]
MRLLRFPERPPQPTRLETERLLLRRPETADFQKWRELRESSRAFLQPYEPTWARDEFSTANWRTRMRRHEADIAQGRSLPWFLFSHDHALLGGITVSNIRRGVADTGTLGYWMGEAYAGLGFMSEAVKAVTTDLFTTHRLHRLEAAAVTDNDASRRLLLTSGFQREGLARGYLRINGQWRDHDLFARLAEDSAPTDRDL